MCGGPSEYGTDQQVPCGVVLLVGRLIFVDCTMFRKIFSLSSAFFFWIL
jgi:hypothetical protein